MAAKRQGLRLTLPGAPSTPHTFPGIPGFYRPDVPTPVGKEGELDLEQAKALDKDEGLALKLEEVPASDVKAAEKLASETLVEARKGLLAENKLAAANNGAAGQGSRERADTEGSQ